MQIEAFKDEYRLERVGKAIVAPSKVDPILLNNAHRQLKPVMQ